jgi:putative peptidoglycan lipid II flippase
MVLNVILIFQFAHAGLALATSLSAFINAGLLLGKLLRKKIYVPAKGWWLFMFRIVLANATMGAILYYGVDTSLWDGWNAMNRAINLAMWIGIAGSTYFIVLLLIGLRLKHFASR